MLKFKCALLCCLFSLSSLLAQEIPIEKLPLDYRPADLLFPEKVDLSNEIIVLDSLVYTISGELPYVNLKQIYEYDNLARPTFFQQFNYDNSDQVLTLNREQTTLYTGNKSIEVVQVANQIGELENAIRYTDCLDEEGLQAIETIEFWDSGVELWNNSRRTIITERTDSTLFSDTYSWDWLIGGFELSSKNETFYNTAHTYQFTSFVLESNGNYKPITIAEYDLFPGSNFKTYDIFRFYDGYYQVWDTLYYTVGEVDLNNKTGHSIEYNKPFGDSNLRLTDSIFVEFDDQLFQKKLFYHSIDILGNKTFDRIAERDYLEDGRFLQIRDFEIDGITPIRVRDWYYSTIVTTHLQKEPIIFPVQLIFRNPATSADIIQIKGTSSQAEQSYDFWITDQQGKIVVRQKINLSDQISLQEKQLPVGMYYLTLFGKKGQKTWKLLLQ